MGIHNFWDVVASSGRNVSIETLSGKRLAVDISIWLNQIVRAMRTANGDTVSNAHIYIVVYRLCKLLYYGIKPVIVFDGSAPALKKKTLERRRERARNAEQKMIALRKEIELTKMAENIKNNKSSEKREVQIASLNDDKHLEEEEEELQSLYDQTTSFSSNHIIFVDIPYKHEVLHIAANTPEILSVPRSLLQVVLKKLQFALQQEIMRKMSSLNPSDMEGISRVQVEGNQYKANTMRYVSSILEKEWKKESERGGKIAVNGYAYSIEEEGGGIFDDSSAAYSINTLPRCVFESETDAHQESMGNAFRNDAEDEMERRRKRMNDAHFEELRGEQELEEEDLEGREEGRMLLYTNLKALMKYNDEEVVRYGDVGNIRRMALLDEGSLLNGVALSGDCVEKVDSEELSTLMDMGGSRYLGLEGDLDKRVRVDDRVVDKEDDDRVVGKEDDDRVVGKEDDDRVVDKWVKEDDDRVVDKWVKEDDDRVVDKWVKEDDDRVVDKEDDDRIERESVKMETERSGELDKRVKEDDDRIERESVKMETERSGELDKRVKEDDDRIERESVKMETEEIEQAESEEEQVCAQKPQEEEDTIQLMRLMQESTRALTERRRSLLQSYRHLSSQNTSVTENVIADIVMLLQIFGIPYVFAPGEAEAQCAFLEMMNLVDGTISNDSDIFAFGGRIVYKNFFSDIHYIEEYRLQDMEEELGLNRERIIEYALLEGCDYCDGIPGIGKVTGIEIVSLFPSLALLSELPNKLEEACKPKEDGIASTEAMHYLHHHRDVLSTLSLSEIMDHNVVSAFMFPRIDGSLQSFAWGSIDLLELQAMCECQPDLDEKRVLRTVQPLVDQKNKERQLRIDQLLTYEKQSFVKRGISKRLHQAFERLTGSL